MDYNQPIVNSATGQTAVACGRVEAMRLRALATAVAACRTAGARISAARTRDGKGKVVGADGKLVEYARVPVTLQAEQSAKPYAAVWDLGSTGESKLPTPLIRERDGRCEAVIVGIACNTLGFTSNARAASPIDTPYSSRGTAASLNSLVNCLRDNPMTQFSIQMKNES